MTPALWAALVADTHLLPRGGEVVLPAPLPEQLAGACAILHAGDIACAEVLERLAEIAPVYAVRGNVDPPDLDLPLHRIVTLGAFRIALAHGDRGPGATTPERARRAFAPEEADVVVFGHSHQALIEREPAGRLLVNPGSPTQPRGRPPTFVVLDLDGPRPQARLVRLDPPAAGPATGPGLRRRGR
jgi:hypothetical protein